MISVDVAIVDECCFAAEWSGSGSTRNYTVNRQEGKEFLQYLMKLVKLEMDLQNPLLTRKTMVLNYGDSSCVFQSVIRFLKDKINCISLLIAFNLIKLETHCNTISQM